jgi:serine/threonine protein kinase
MDNGDLGKLIKGHQTLNKPIDEERLWNIFIQALQSLEYVHKRGLIMDSIALPILTGLSFVNPIFIPFAVFSGVSLAVNFQCVNLQNYNLYRLEKNKDVITRKERQTIRQTQEKYTDGVKVINKVIDSDGKILE